MSTLESLLIRRIGGAECLIQYVPKVTDLELRRWLYSMASEARRESMTALRAIRQSRALEPSGGGR